MNVLSAYQSITLIGFSAGPAALSLLDTPGTVNQSIMKVET
jgi:hypothetical protein